MDPSWVIGPIPSWKLQGEARARIVYFSSPQARKEKSMVTKKARKKNGKKGRVKTLHLKRETVKI